MKAASWRRLISTYFGPDLPPHIVARNLVLLLPVGQILRGLSAQSSAFDATTFAVQVFVMPTYVPCSHIYFVIGDRLGTLGGEPPGSWTLTPENEAEVMREILELTKIQALPFLKRFEMPADVAEYIDQDVHPDSRRNDPYLAEIEAYSWILAGQAARALVALDRLEKIGNSNEANPSINEILERARHIKVLLQGSPAAALEQLAERRRFTLDALRLNG